MGGVLLRDLSLRLPAKRTKPGGVSGINILMLKLVFDGESSPVY